MALSSFVKPKSWRVALGALALGAGLAAISVAPAQAHDGWDRRDNGWHDGWRRDAWREHEWRAHDWRWHRPAWSYGYRAPPVTYSYPAPRYYYPSYSYPSYGGLSVYIPLR